MMRNPHTRVILFFLAGAIVGYLFAASAQEIARLLGML